MANCARSAATPRSSYSTLPVPAHCITTGCHRAHIGPPACAASRAKFRPPQVADQQRLKSAVAAGGITPISRRHVKRRLSQKSVFDPFSVSLPLGFPNAFCVNNLCRRSGPRLADC
jgi:hypothetical protein